MPVLILNLIEGHRLGTIFTATLHAAADDAAVS
jgi:hypothetical protein